MKTTIKILAVLTLMLLWAGTVHAATLTVTTTDDELNSDGDCSLREAIQAANTDTAVDACFAGSGTDIITVPAGTYNLSMGDLDLANVTINGTGTGSTIINQTQAGQRVFETIGVVNISRVTIQGGKAGASSTVPTHLHGGGLHNHGTVTLTNVTFTGNSALNFDPMDPSGTSGKGGAIWNAGAMTLINVTIGDNTAAVSGAGIGGGAPTLTNTIVANNSPDNCSVTITAGSNNLQFPAFLQPSDLPSCGDTIPVVDPLLGPLIDGVYPLLAGSLAIDTVPNIDCPPPPIDQLGTARPQGRRCDIGAFELVDVTPPVIVANVAPPPNANGWNNTDVTATWNVSDPESGIESSDSGCETTILTSETAGTPLTCSATNRLGLSSSESVTVKIDNTLPTVTYAGNAGVYTVDQTVNITCSATDNLSGVGSTTCADISGPASSFGLGTHTFSATATDLAGNVGSGSTTFTVINPPVAQVFIGEQEMPGSPFRLAPSVSILKRFPGINGGPVKIEGNVDIVASERIIYKVNRVNTSFSEMMGLPDNQLDTTYWFPWYNNRNLNTQLRFANTSGGTAHVHIFIGGDEMTGSPFTLLAGESTHKRFPNINAGPVEIVSDQNIVVTERVIYKVNGIPTSFSEMMGLPNSQLDTTYWLPWYNNRNLNTQLRFANVSNQPASVHVFIGDDEMTGSPFTLLAGESTHKRFPGINAGPVKIVSNRNIVASERIIYKVNGTPTSFSEMMALPNNQLDTTYWLPWYNNRNLNTQLRFANTTGSTATVHIFIGGDEMTGSPFTLLAGESTRKRFAGINAGPVKIVSNVPIIAAQWVIYKVNNVNTSFSEMMALPDNQLDTTYWFPWYNNVNLNTQLRFGMP